MVAVTGTADSRQKDFMRKTGNAGELDKHAFLELLITQLRYQDPLNPSANSEFLAQMAQFTSLEQVQNINAGMEKLLSSQAEHQARLLEKMDNLNENMESLLYLFQLSQFTSLDQELLLLGKDVTVKTAEGQEIVGKVSAVKLGQGGNRLVVNGQTFSLAQLVKVKSGDENE
ncbi:MAG: hypothetical protein C4554_03650 [Dethiobacter sp.]|jgi:flagellar basal-body rod modification protein FlgD|nr:MAG: hypothetical protein C4554_03650 [Dethiobacter sp.]